MRSTALEEPPNGACGGSFSKIYISKIFHVRAHQESSFHWCPPSCIPEAGQEVKCWQRGFVALFINASWTSSQEGVSRRRGGWRMCTWVQTVVGLFTHSPINVIVPHFKFSTSQSSSVFPTTAAVWLLNPHNLPPAASSWSFLATSLLSTSAWSGYNNSMALCWY